jgi:hypothetical protein
MPILLMTCGLTALVLGTWRSYAAVREALSPIVHDGEATRTNLEAELPIYRRSRARRFMRRLVVSFGWLSIALYGLFLVTVGLGLP